MKQGDLYWAILNAFGTDNNIRRPVLILSKSEDRLICLPIMSGVSKLGKNIIKLPYISSLKKESFIDISETRLISKKRLSEKIGNLAEPLLNEILQQFKNSFTTFNENELKEKAKETLNTFNNEAEKLLYQALPSKQEPYDIFLSHSIHDKDLVLGLKEKIEGLKFSVYVDWEDKKLDRNNVSKETADRLKQIMDNCKCLLVVDSDKSQESKWIPWELGFFDGLNGKVGVISVIPAYSINTFSGREYFKLYPNVKIGEIEGITSLWLDGKEGNLINLREWIK